MATVPVFWSNLAAVADPSGVEVFTGGARGGLEVAARLISCGKYRIAILDVMDASKALCALRSSGSYPAATAASGFEGNRWHGLQGELTGLPPYEAVAPKSAPSPKGLSPRLGSVSPLGGDNEQSGKILSGKTLPPSGVCMKKTAPRPTLQRQRRDWLPFEEARAYARSLKLRTRAMWDAHSKRGRRPKNIPSAPHLTYKGKGWQGYGDWLGTGNVRSRVWMHFADARAFARNLNLRSKAEWGKWRKSGARPKNIPSNPDTIYRTKGWRGYDDWLGTDAVLHHTKPPLFPPGMRKRPRSDQLTSRAARAKARKLENMDVYDLGGPSSSLQVRGAENGNETAAAVPSSVLATAAEASASALLAATTDDAAEAAAAAHMVAGLSLKQTSV